MKSILHCLAVVCLLSLTSCATQHEVVISENASAEELYNQAYNYLERTSYQKAAETFDKVEMEHPYSKWATKSKIMSAYSYYKDEKYDDAINALDRFIRLHPGNKDIAYAYYLKGVCFYDQIAPSQKEQSATKDAYDTFSQVITMFPDSEYATDAKAKMALIEDHLAGHEMNVGRYYLFNKEYISALNRFSTVTELYQTTSQIEEALYREVEIYTLLGLNAEAKKKEGILRSNYPNGKWTEKASELVSKG
jgi:outer membrane protein assembly factor BamD